MQPNTPKMCGLYGLYIKVFGLYYIYITLVEQTVKALFSHPVVIRLNSGSHLK